MWIGSHIMTINYQSIVDLQQEENNSNYSPQSRTQKINPFWDLQTARRVQQQGDVEKDDSKLRNGEC